MLKLVPKLKTNKSLKLPPANMRANSSILVRLEMDEMAQNKQKRFMSDKIKLVELVSY